MNDYIARLIRAGMPRSVAISVCRQIRRSMGDIKLARYVEAVEGENDGTMAAI